MAKPLDIRQSAYRSILQEIMPWLSGQTVDILLSSVNQDLTPPLKVDATSSPSLVVNIGPSIVSNSNSFRNKSISFINNIIPDFTGGTVTFPASSGGNITTSTGGSFPLTLPSGDFVQILLGLDNTAHITVQIGTPASSVPAAIVPSPESNILPFCYITLSNVGGVIQNVTQSTIFQLSSSSGGGSSGALTYVTISSSTTLAINTINGINATPSSISIDSLVVAGGGGGGTSASSGSGAGGGAGGMLYTTGSSYSIGTYTVTVGNGGSGSTSPGGNGSNSVFDVFTAIGGGGGGDYANVPGNSGGSGGGGGATNSSSLISGGSGTVGQGNAGGNNGSQTFHNGGGGGAGAVGANATSTPSSGDGGVGLANSISGSSVFYAGGGGGGGDFTDIGPAGLGGNGGGGNGSKTNGVNGAAGTANTGGGGGGATSGGGGNIGGSGGSGIVILSYNTASASGLTITGGTVTINGSNTVRTFTSSGTLSISEPLILTMPPPTNAAIVDIKDISGNASMRNIIINHNSSENIDGNPSYTINTNYGAVSLFSDGTNWFIQNIYP